ncbi:MATE family efflux transporter [Nocardiopsis oceani]
MPSENTENPAHSTPAESEAALPTPKLASRIGRKAFPLYTSMVAALAGTMVTAGVLGNTRTEELAAHALVTAVLGPVVMVLQGVQRGSMPFVAENEDHPGVLAATVRDGTWVALLSGLLGGLAVLSVPLLAGVIGVAEETRAALGAYPLLMAAYAVVAALSASATVLLTSLGRSKTVMVLGLTTTALSVVVIPVLVLGLGPTPALGLFGAGVATLLVGCVVLVIKFATVSRLSVLGGQSVLPRAPRWSRIWEMTKVGAPTGSTLLVKSVALSVVVLVVARAGAADAAAHQLLVITANFVFLPALATGQAAIPFIVRAVKNSDGLQARRTLLAAYAVAVPVTGLVLVAVPVLIQPFAELMSHDPAVRSVMVSLVPLLLLMALADNLQVVSGMGLVALKRTTPSMYTFLVCYGILVAASLPVSAAAGIAGVWSVYALTTAGLVVGQGMTFLRVSREISTTP